MGAALAVAELAGAPLPRVDHRYRLTRILGRGANGVVVEAHDERLDRDVALKLFAEWDDRVLREARAIAKLDHPNVIRVHDVGVGELQAEGEGALPCAYLSMALVRGLSLRDWLAERPSDARIRSVLAAAGEGLAAAHSAGLVHRDIKPENIMVGPKDRALVVDFGLARPPPKHGDLATLAGTPPYMAPEARTGEVSAAADVYAFGRVVVEALSGALPSDERGLEVILEGLGKRLRAPLRRALDPNPKRRSGIPSIVKALHRPHGSMAWSLLLFAVVSLAVAHQVSPKFRGWVASMLSGRSDTSEAKPPTPTIHADCSESAGNWVLSTSVVELGTATRGVGAQGRYEMALSADCSVAEIFKTDFRDGPDRRWRTPQGGAVRGEGTRTWLVTSDTLGIESKFNDATYRFNLQFNGGGSMGSFEQLDSNAVVWSGRVIGLRPQ